MKLNRGNYIALVLVLILIIILGISLLKNEKTKEDCYQVVQDYVKAKSDFKEMTEYLIEKDSLQFLSEEATIDLKEFVVSIKENDSLVLKEQIEPYGLTMVFVLRENHCFDCYRSFFDIVKQTLHSSSSKNRIIFLVDFRTMRLLENSGLSDLIDYNFYFYTGNEEWGVERMNSPYMFIMDNVTGKCRNFYIVNRSYNQGSMNYLKHTLDILKSN